MYEHPDDFESDLRPYCSMRAAAESDNFESGHSRSCAYGGGGDCSCGVIPMEEYYLEMTLADHPLTFEEHTIYLAAEEKAEDLEAESIRLWSGRGFNSDDIPF